ncbi:hypothetical protein XENOCAPTIV_013839 [Xenoophorus captivus]|uniref:G-protein coupled receptors family 1 profile domain-containing protein n=1 Tax=Xenoophorus captivus TaxID=1517983 RepID=A0ABV0RYL9_9TELE
MAPSLVFLLCLYFPLQFIHVKSVEQQDKQQRSTHKSSYSVQLKALRSGKQLQTADDTYNPEESPPLPDMVDLDLERRLRLARGADEDEQQSTFSHSFENEWVTTPQVTEFSNTTKVEITNNHRDETNIHTNASNSDDEGPGLFNPFYPLAKSSYVAYVVLFLAGLVLAVGVVANMAVMCVVWNNYYMRSAWNYLLASIAFWDFLVLVVCLPVVVLNHLSNRRILGDITCRMVPYMEGCRIKDKHTTKNPAQPRQHIRVLDGVCGARDRTKSCFGAFMHHCSLGVGKDWPHW